MSKDPAWDAAQKAARAIFRGAKLRRPQSFAANGDVVAIHLGDSVVVVYGRDLGKLELMCSMAGRPGAPPLEPPKRKRAAAKKGLEMRTPTTIDELYQRITEALDAVKSAQVAISGRAAVACPALVLPKLGEARGALDVAAQEIERELAHR